MSYTEIPEGDRYVYRHIRPDKNEPFYIGIGKGYRAYCKQGRNKIWQAIVDKNGGEYRVDILFDGVSAEFAKAKEMELVLLHGRINNKTGILSNLTDGGDGTHGMVVDEAGRKRRSEAKKGEKHHQFGKPLSDETKAKMSAKLKGQFLGEKNPMYGKKHWLGKTHTEETKKKISELKKGLHGGSNNPAYRGKVYAFYMGIKVAEFESVRAADVAMGLTFGAVGNALNKQYKTVAGFEWRRFSEGDCLKDGQYNKSFKGYFYQIDFNTGELIDIHMNACDAGRKYGVNISGIYGCASGKYIQSSGYKWIISKLTEKEFREQHYGNR